MAIAKNILVFTCFNARSIHMESTVLYFKHKGYKVFFLTTCRPGPIHSELKRKGVVAKGMELKGTSGMFYYIRMISFLVKYCREQHIDFLHSHLQIPNLISSISRFFIKARVFTTRHNSDVIEISGSFKEKLIEKLINVLSPHIIAISDKVKQQLIEKEHVNPKKIHRINNGYNFSEYEKLSIDKNEYLAIRQRFNCEFLLVSPGRLIPTKRHQLTIQGIKELCSKGFDVKLLILGDGPEREVISALIAQLELTDRIYLLGYFENVSDYLKASDAIVLLSESEASSNIIKEAGYFEKPVIACENVGDFSDYIISGTNGLLVSKQKPLSGFVKSVEALYNNRTAMSGLGANLRNTILKEFDMESVGKKYEELQEEV